MIINHGTEYLLERRLKQERPYKLAAFTLLTLSFVFMGFCIAYAVAMGWTSFY